MGFASVGALATASEESSWLSTWRKSPTAGTTAGVWFDLSMSPGNPVPQYYAAAPLQPVALTAADGGLFHGGPVSPAVKHVRTVGIFASAATALPMPVILCDYLMFYPFFDDGVLDPQTTSNGVTLPRYTDGTGVQIMAVSVAARTGGQSFTVSYTNSAGVSGRTTVAALQTSAASNGSIVSSATLAAAGGSPFLSLQAGDTGVRSIESVTMLGPDVGLMTLVLVKPLVHFQLRELTAPVEVDCFTDLNGAPVVADGAYLNLLCNPRGVLSATTLHGYIQTAWN